jgi:hypothetical protein
MKNLHIFGKQKLLENISILTVVTLNKKIVEQMPQLSIEEFSIIRNQSNLEAIGKLAYKIIIHNKEDGKFYWIHEMGFNNFMQEEIRKISPKMKNDTLYVKAQEFIDKMPQLFEK